MFGTLSNKLQAVFSKLGQRSLSEKNIEDAVREVRLALLEADVQYGVAKTFIKRVKDQVLGEKVIKSVRPGEQFVKVVHDELVALMGEGEASLTFKGRPSVIMMCGLQGAGKTTACAKLARYLQKHQSQKRIMMAACDLQRPAAIDQLCILGKQIDVPVFTIDGEKRPLVVAKEALKKAERDGCDVLIVDTAGRLHIDDKLMEELAELKKLLKPAEILFVANATTGQDAVNSALAVHQAVDITGSILTMLDGDTRGGAAISIREITGRPLKFEGVGERLEDFQLFNPNSMADRILGMGDVINLVKQAQEHVDEKEAKEMEQKLRKAQFTYDDLLKQMGMMEKLGSFKKILKMLPMGQNIPDEALSGVQGHVTRTRAIIQSMTPDERRGDVELIMNRRRRIAAGSGTSLDDVNRLAKQFRQMKQFMKQTGNVKKLQKMVGGPQ